MFEPRAKPHRDLRRRRNADDFQYEPETEKDVNARTGGFKSVQHDT